MGRFSPLLSCTYSKGSLSTLGSEGDKENLHVQRGHSKLEGKSSMSRRRKRFKGGLTSYLLLFDLFTWKHSVVQSVRRNVKHLQACDASTPV